MWRINRQKDTIQQYLGTYSYQPADGTSPLNNINYHKDGIYYSKSPDSGLIHKAITFEKFMEMEWYAVISSIPQHIKPHKHLASMKKAYHIFQEGNNFNLPDDSYDNLMSSTLPRSTTCHSVFYHQEFDTGVFNYKKPGKKKEIHTYVNVFKDFPDYQLFLDLEKEMPDYVFKIHGSQSRDGCISGIQKLADSMADARWIFHAKRGGDGYGFTIHQAMAVGRPLLVMRDYYNGHLAGQMVTDKNSLVIDGMIPKEIADKIRASEDRNAELSRNVYNTFTSYVDFDEDAKKIQFFLNNLI